jgi:hypothetical protein
MFRRFHQNNSPNSWVLKIVDDDFVELFQPYWSNFFIEVIRVYELRKLPVVPNLILSMQFYLNNNHSGSNSVADLLDKLLDQPAVCIAFAPYKDELVKYLVLL